MSTAQVMIGADRSIFADVRHSEAYEGCHLTTLGCAETLTWNRVLQFYRTRFPNKEFADEFPELGRYRAFVEGRARAEYLLRESFGRGFMTFDEAMEIAVESFE